MIRWADLRRGDVLVFLNTKQTCIIYILADAPDPHDSHSTDRGTHRCRFRRESEKRRRVLRTCQRAWKPAALLEAVREFVMTRRAKGEELITAEEVAGVLRARKGDVTGCFVKLVAEGLVGRKKRIGPSDGCWWPSVYFLLRVSKNRGDE